MTWQTDPLKVLAVILLAFAIILWVVREGLALTHLECSQCGERATVFPDGYDDYCQECYDEHFAECASCGNVVPVEDLGSTLWAPQSGFNPAEYCETCAICAPDTEYYAEEDR